MKKLLSLITFAIVSTGCSNIEININPQEIETPQHFEETSEKIISKITKSTEISESPKAPNILLIIADDMGMDASPWHMEYKGQKPYTPVLDRLAKEGLIFDNVWSNPLCSPTRSSILTGKYGVHTGVLGALAKKDEGISLDEHSIQKMIAEKSPTKYRQAVIGKWHLSTANNGDNDNPNLMGVPYYSGYPSGAMQDYNNWKKVTNGKTTTSTVYATTDFTDEAISWIGQTNETPWFLWLAYTAPHTPFHMPPENLLSEETKNSLTGHESDIQDNPVPYYLAAIEAMDTEIGRLLESLSKEEKDNTVILFVGDNGTPAKVTQIPFKKSESKGSISRGGIHVPMIVSGNGIVSGRNKALINVSDLYATIAELSGITLSQYENSTSFAPLLFGNHQKTRDYIYAEVSSPSKKEGKPNDKNGWTVRQNGYQYISLDNRQQKLFADSDLSQTNDLINTLPQIAEQLKNLGKSIRNKTVSTNTNSDLFLSTKGYGTVRITTDNQYRHITSDGIPEHEPGTFPTKGNPNTISEQNHNYRVPIIPVYSEKIIPVQLAGVALNGVPLEPGTAEFYNKDRNSGWNEEAFYKGIGGLGIDWSNAHVQPNGTYHYHANPNGLLQTALAEQSDDLVHLAWAADGFPIYYAQSNKYNSSYELKSGTRSSGPGGNHDGKYTEDYQYVEGLGILDECNGLFINGQYLYLITKSFPYINRCTHAVPDSSFVKRDPRSTAISGTTQNTSTPVKTNTAKDEPKKAISICANKNIGETCSFTSPKRSVTGYCKDSPKFGKLCTSR